jgi:O-acetyl-ADP-ribose deacetylase (regulator of RNase III)
MKKELSDKIEIIQGDITKLDIDAIVNAANRSLLGGGGVDGAIHRAAGPKLLEECRKLGGCDTGEAKITQGYNLKARHVIHTVGPVYGGKPQDAVLLSMCYANSLDIAARNNISSVAFPAISCGVYGYPMEDACKIAVDTVCGFLTDKKSSLKKIFFVLFSRSDYELYKNYLKTI